MNKSNAVAVALRYLLSAISRIKQHESKLSLILHSVGMARSTNKVGLIIFYHRFEVCKGLLVEFLLKHSKKCFLEQLLTPFLSNLQASAVGLCPSPSVKEPSG